MIKLLSPPWFKCFFINSPLSLWKKFAGQDNDTLQRNNICNTNRKANIATLYLAKAMGLSVANIISATEFVYNDDSLVYTFPFHDTDGPSVVST